MANENRRIQGPVHTRSDDSIPRVALELAREIEATESDKTKNRDYWLDLMCDCHYAASYGTRRQK